MEIKCTVEELKELLKKEAPVAGTTNAKRVVEPIKNAYFIDEIIKSIKKEN